MDTDDLQKAAEELVRAMEAEAAASKPKALELLKRLSPRFRDVTSEKRGTVSAIIGHSKRPL